MPVMDFLIVEDEPIIAQRIERLVRLFFSDNTDVNVGRLTTCRSLSEVLGRLEEHPIDAVLLDLNINGRDGFEVLEQLSAESFHTIIISAYADRAITAFEYGVIDFIEKPFDQSRLFKALTRLVDINIRSGGYRKSIAIKVLGKIERMNTDDIVWLQADGHYSVLHSAHGDERLHDKSLDRLLQVLPENFVRVHRSYAVNWNHVRGLKIESGGKYSLELMTSQIPVSRKMIAMVKSRMGT